MNATQQFYELVATAYSRIEDLKQMYRELGENIINITAAYQRGEISQIDYDDLIAQTCNTDLALPGAEQPERRVSRWTHLKN